MSSTNRRMLSLDVIRGGAALAVLISHWGGWTNPGNPVSLGDLLVSLLQRAIAFVWSGGGIHPGVIVFIVLSGFCIHLPIARHPESTSQPTSYWKMYAKRRLLRIGPVYVIAALLGILASITAFSTSLSLNCPGFVLDSDRITPIGIITTFAALPGWGAFPGNRPLAACRRGISCRLVAGRRQHDMSVSYD